MKLSAALLCEKLPQYIRPHFIGSGFNSLCLSRPEFFTPNLNKADGKLLIAAPGQEPPDISSAADSCLICIGGAPPFVPLSGGSVLYAEEGIDIFFIFNELQALYDTYDEWDDSLHRCISARGSMQQIIDESGFIFENPICSVDASMTYTALSDYARRRGDATGILPRDAAEIFRPDLLPGEILLERDDIIIRLCGINGRRFLSASLKSHQKFVIGIFLIEHRGKLCSSDTALLLHMSAYVMKLFEYNAAMTTGDTMSLVTVFIRLLDHQAVTQASLESALDVFGWRVDDSYDVYYLVPPERDFDYRYISDQGRQIELQLPSSLGIAYGGNIVVIHNLTRTEENEPASGLHAFLRDRRRGYGRSRTFGNINELSSHYEQAVYALEHGKVKYPRKLFHRFSDYCLDFMIGRCCETQKPESLFLTGFLELLDHDQRHGTAYIPTLSAFCTSNFNATHAANALHIHRTTLLDRLKRINEISGIDFSDNSERLHLMLSLAILHNFGGMSGA